MSMKFALAIAALWCKGSLVSGSTVRRRMQEISASELAANNSPDSCWLQVDDVAYDASGYSSSHPGGASNIEKNCGTDITPIFASSNSAHTTDTLTSNLIVLGKVVAGSAPVAAPAPTGASGPVTCPSVPDTGCSVCGEGMCVTNPDAIFSYPGQPVTPCGILEQAGYGGIIPLDQCPFLSALLTDCECKSGSAGPSPVAGTTPPVASPVAGTTPPVASPVAGTSAPVASPVAGTSAPAVATGPVAAPAPTGASGPVTCPSVPDTGCSVCGEGMCVTNPDAIFSYPGQPVTPCGILEQAGYGGIIPLDQCPFLSALLTDCECKSGSAGPSPVAGTTPPVASPVAGTTPPVASPVAGTSAPVASPVAGTSAPGTIAPVATPIASPVAGTSAPAVATGTSSPIAASNTVTASDLAMNNSPESCWVQVDDSAYDVTAYAPQHPGGELKIHEYCGQDITADFAPTNSGHTNENLMAFTIPLGRVVADGSPTAMGTGAPVGAPAAMGTGAPVGAPAAMGSIAPVAAPTASPPVATSNTVTASDLAMNNSPESCWVQVDDSAYDVTAYAPQHPGGELKIHEYCGQDITADFAPTNSGHTNENLMAFTIPLGRVVADGSPTAMGTGAPVGAPAAMGTGAPVGAPAAMGTGAPVGAPAAMGTGAPVGAPVAMGTGAPVGAPAAMGSIAPVAAPTASPPVATSNTVTASDLAMNNSPESCWVQVDDSAYDVTAYAPQHPGGELKIHEYCGQDITADFAPTNSGHTNENLMAFTIPLGRVVADGSPTTLTPVAVGSSGPIAAPVSAGTGAPVADTKPSVGSIGSLGPVADLFPDKDGICQDNPDARFFVERTGKDEPCRWLEARPSDQEELCRPSHPSMAFYICEETCKKCTDNCQDQDDSEFKFIIVEDGEDKIRTCLWLFLRPGSQEELCKRDDVKVGCAETCQLCPTQPPSSAPCEDNPSASFPTPSGDQGCMYLSEITVEERQPLCDPASGIARESCPESCAACSDNCVDSTTETFEYEGGQQTCAWLSTNVQAQADVCYAWNNAWEACKESCNHWSCNIAEARK